MSSKLRKRFFVSEGELFGLFAEVEQVRHEEKREQFRARFRALLKEAQEVELVPRPKAQKGGGHEA